MNFVFDSRPSDSPFVEQVWRTQSEGGGSFVSVAESRWGMVITRQKNGLYFTIRGPETKASIAPVPEDAEFFGVIFQLGTYMPLLPAHQLINNGIDFPNTDGRSASGQHFWLAGSAWQFPTFENVDTFLARLAHDGLIAKEPVVHAALNGHLRESSLRSVQRRFVRTTGLTQKAIQQIERAKQATALLEQGVSILDTVAALGYFDQAHMTHALKRLIGKTPAQILRKAPVTEF
ncbi:MAG: helix-turn-helix domain-containing protein [Anaerolineae bacterium]